MANSKIIFNVPFISGKEREYIEQVFSNGQFSGNGPFTKRCQEWLEDRLQSPLVLLTNSCTAGLEMASMLSDLGPGDEVIIPSFTFVTTASSVMRTGATPVFCEIEPETMQIDFHDAASRVTTRTKAIVPVHYAGFSTDMDFALEFCESHGLTMIEDAAQGLGSSWKDGALGSFAPLSAISFHETKNIHCGLGGCLVVNDESLIDKAEIIWERGTDRSAFFKGLVDKYSWREVGSSFYPSELQAAFLLAQLESLERNLSRRMEIWNEYSELLKPLEESGGIRVLRPPPESTHNAHMMAVILNSAEEANSVRVGLNESGIQAVIHYVPLHTSGMGGKMGYSPEDLPITKEFSERLLRLPLHHEIDSNAIERVVGRLAELLS
jgi:dTDP-4-amino-4,6-dideoxygalactose transaminase